MDIAIVGGSLGGLTAACLLADAGHRVEVYERSPSELEERGAGIGFLEATYRYLVAHGGIQLDDVAVKTGHIRYLDRDGLVSHDDEHRYLFSSWNTVYRQLLGCFDRAAYRLAHELVDIELEPLTLSFSNGLVTQPDLAVFADGVASTARAALLPDVLPRYAGYVAWRGVVPETELTPDTRAALDDAITYYVYANSHILVYPIPGRDGSVVPGERLINIVWYRNYLPGDDLDDLLLDVNGIRREVSVPPGALRSRPHRRSTRGRRGAPARPDLRGRDGRRRSVRASGARPRCATDGVRPELSDRRCRLRCPPARCGRNGKSC